MASAEEHAELIFSAIIPSRRDLLDKMLRQLTTAHFPDRTQQVFYQILERYYQATGGILTSSALEDMFRDRDPGQRMLYAEKFDAYLAKPVEDAEFIWSIQELRELATERATAEALNDAMVILRTGLLDEATNETIKGQQPARERLMEAMAIIDRDLLVQEAPEGDLREERDEILQEYAERKHARLSGQSTGVNFGISELDAKVGGMQNGELVLAAGYSSDGKTTLCTQTAWSAAVEQGANVLFLTTETIRPQVRRKLISRHSMQPQFGLPMGLNSNDIKQGLLTEADETVMKEILLDLEKNPTYGKIVIAQVPRGSTISYIERVMERYQRQFDVGMVVMDYLALLSPGRNKQSSREELSSILKEAKLVATSFADGRGVPLMSPWQVNREARTQAENLGMYTSKAMAETAEATNSADLIISLLNLDAEKQRKAEITMQILKARDGETANGLITEVDYATSYFKSRTGSAQFASLSSTSGGSSFGGASFDALLD